MSDRSYKLICMSFDGEYQKEQPKFNTIEAAWEHSNDIGSKWYFYPFHFVVSNSGLTVVDTLRGLGQFKGKRVVTVARKFNEVSEQPEHEAADTDTFILYLRE